MFITPRCLRPLLCLVVSSHAALRGEGEVKVVVEIPHDRRVQLSCKGHALRLQLVPKDGREPLETAMLDPDLAAGTCSKVAYGEDHGVASSDGSITVNKQGVLKIRQGGKIITTSMPIRSDHEIAFHDSIGRLVGGGGNPKTGKSLSTPKSDPWVGNTGVAVPHYWSEVGYAALGVVESSDANKYPASYELKSYDSGKRVHWLFKGKWDLYLMPAPTMLAGTRSYYALTGRPTVPPRYAFGFIASRWGWKDRAYIEGVLRNFSNGHYPLDAIVLDFEWFTTNTDYGFPAGGCQKDYDDFGFNKALFPEPNYQLADYSLRYNVKVAGIRKPRIGGCALLNEMDENRWLLPHCEPSGRTPPDYPGYACGRNLDYSKPAVRTWYAKKLKPLLEKGMTFWWNDEGETDYFTFHWWNVAEVEALKLVKPEDRFFSLNRAFSPGMGRLGATVWTGDVDAKWDWLRNTPGTMLNWVLAGAAMVSCDSGGFIGQTTADLLIRWLQVACFMPVMRVHSELTSTPHFPWLWGQKAGEAIQEILNLRYRLLPYHYSLAHGQAYNGQPWIRPLEMDYPKTPEVKDLATEWMDGLILVAPVLREDSTHEIILPPGLWYSLDKTLELAEEADLVPIGTSVEGHDSLVVYGNGVHMKKKVPLKQVPCFVRPGSILPLSPVVQHSDDIGIWPLQVFVFAGQDGEFTLVEDDGITTKYKTGEYRSSVFKWSDEEKTLRWQSFGYVAKGFTEIAVYFVNIYGQVTKSDTYQFTFQGTIGFKAAEEILQ